jgi:hypothetical protein
LFLLGFEDELTNFTLGLTNPSKQSDLLGIELWKEKITLFKDAVAPIQDSVAPVSASWAKKHILGFSDDEIRLDLQQQRIERAVSAELGKTAEVITKTGLFDTLDSLYGKKDAAAGGAPAEGGAAPAGGAPPEEGGMPPEAGGGAPPPPPAEGGGVTPENFNRNDLNLILENTLFDRDNTLDLSKGRLSINEIDDKINKLLNK